MRRLNKNTPKPTADQTSDPRADLRAEVREAITDLDPHYTARRALREEPGLLARLDTYIEAGGAPISVPDGVSRLRQITAVEGALDAFDASRSDIPCGACGVHGFRWPYGISRPLDPDARPPAHQTRTVTLGDDSREIVLCGFCSDQVSHRSEGLDGYARAVLGAKAGYKSLTGLDSRALLAIEAPARGDGRTPWSHLPSAAVVGIATTALRRREWMVSRLVRSPGQRIALAESVGLPPDAVHVWTSVPTPDPLPSVNPAETVEMRKRREREDRERNNLAAQRRVFEKRKADRAEAVALLDSFVSEHPNPHKWDEATRDEYAVLLDSHAEALGSFRAVFADGRGPGWTPGANR